MTVLFTKNQIEHFLDHVSDVMLVETQHAQTHTHSNTENTPCPPAQHHSPMPSLIKCICFIYTCRAVVYPVGHVVGHPYIWETDNTCQDLI